MAFKLQPPDRFHAKVEIPEPGGTTQPLEVDFKWLSRDEFAAYCKERGGDGDEQFFAGLILGWDADEDLNAAGLAKMFGYRPGAGRALFAAYRRELLEVEEKN